MASKRNIFSNICLVFRNSKSLSGLRSMCALRYPNNRTYKFSLLCNTLFPVAVAVVRGMLGRALSAGAVGGGPFDGSALGKASLGITECLGLEGTSVGHLVQPLCRSRVTYSRLHRTLSRWVLNISRDGDSTTSLGSLFQCSVTLRGKKFFLMFTESQNHRIVGVGRDLCGSSSPTPLPKQGHLQ